MFFFQKQNQNHTKKPISTIRKNSTDKIHVYMCGYFSKFWIEYKIEKESIDNHKVNTWTLVEHIYVLFCSFTPSTIYLSISFPYLEVIACSTLGKIESRISLVHVLLDTGPQLSSIWVLCKWIWHKFIDNVEARIKLLPFLRVLGPNSQTLSFCYLK